MTLIKVRERCSYCGVWKDAFDLGLHLGLPICFECVMGQCEWITRKGTRCCRDATVTGVGKWLCTQHARMTSDGSMPRLHDSHPMFDSPESDAA